MTNLDNTAEQVELRAAATHLMDLVQKQFPDFSKAKLLERGLTAVMQGASIQLDGLDERSLMEGYGTSLNAAFAAIKMARGPGVEQNARENLAQFLIFGPREPESLIFTRTAEETN